MPDMFKLKKGTGIFLSYFILIVEALMILLPIWLIFICSFRTKSQIIQYPPVLWPYDGSFENYKKLLNPEVSGYTRWFLNSSIYAFTSTFLILLISSMAGYGFAKKKFWGKDIIFIIILATLMIPGVVMLIPQFMIISSLNLLDSYAGLIIPSLGSTFGVFLMTQFIKTIPSSIEESALMDGCHDWRVFFSIILPIAKPSMGILAIFTFISQWSNLLWPLVIVNSDEMRTLTVGIAGMKSRLSSVSGEIMAATFLSFIPVLIVFMFARERFIEGLTAGAVKG